MNFIRENLFSSLKRKIWFSVLFLLVCATLSVFSLSNTNSQTQLPPSCATIEGNAEPGKNCLFEGQLLCNAVPSASYTTSPSYVALNPSHRSNCFNLSDLTLCSQVAPGKPVLPGKNCARECGDPFFSSGQTGVRGVDYAVHNRDCVRFCDSAEKEGITPNQGTNCISRACHQLADGVAPIAGQNCSMLTCNLLSANELTSSKFDDATKKYCDGDNVKCLEFSQDKLEFMRVRANNPTCQLHNCRTSAETCTPYANDDVQKVLNKGEAYKISYFKEICRSQCFLADGAPTSAIFCKPTTCLPIIKSQYRCLPLDAATPTTRNNECDSAGAGAICNNGYCYKTTDCNLPANINASECRGLDNSGGPDPADDTNSWFYRPAPNLKSVVGNGVIRNMESGLCYTSDQMESHGWGTHPKIDFGLLGMLDFGYFSDYLTNPGTISPGSCGGKYTGNRGPGYGYVCGLIGNFTDLPDTSQAGFHKGYVKTNYSGADGTHKLTACIRFNNTMIPGRTCGSRECGVTYAGFMGGLWGQNCGSDVCVDLEVNDKNPRECEMNDDMFNNKNDGKGCAKTIDGYMRVRAVKYSSATENRICTYLDHKGSVAFSNHYFNGSEKLSDGSCVSGVRVGDSCVGAKNTNDSKTVPDVWRTVMRIPYINNVMDGKDGRRGFLDKNGRFFKEQECIKVPNRVTSPKFYNLGIMANSPKLFTIPPYIANARIYKGGPIASAASGKEFGVTSFHRPQIEVRYGNDSKLLSLDFSYDGKEDVDANHDPNSIATLTTEIYSITSSTEVFIRKEFDASLSKPLLCAYQRFISNADGSEVTSSLGCVDRQMPEINNSNYSSVNPFFEFMAFKVEPDPANKYNDAGILFKYLTSTDLKSTPQNCSAQGAACSAPVAIFAKEASIEKCDINKEGYKVCAKREECTKLSNECIDNEIKLRDAKKDGKGLNTFLATKNYCDKFLLPMCNSKKGIAKTSEDSTVIDVQPVITADNKSYGWFNEICISSGFNHALKKVITYKIGEGLPGKCLVSPLSPYLTDSDPSTNCDSGGRLPNCICAEYLEDMQLNDNQVSRLQTMREAGLCINIPEPEACDAIDYNTDPINGVDIDYMQSSLDKDFYGVNGVHSSHKSRFTGKFLANGITIDTHAEFPRAIFGFADVEGVCSGFWKNQTNNKGVSLIPTMSCLNVNGKANWGGVTNDCVRYTCPAIYTNGPNENGIYDGTYGALESGEDVGKTSGFATWHAYTKTNDFTEYGVPKECIPGFKKIAATPIFPGSYNITTASLFNKITGYSGGSLPKRRCDQLGKWLPAENACERIACPDVNPSIPKNSSDKNSWNLWQNSGGATFPSVKASRSKERIQNESISTGTCNNRLGFFQAPGSAAPIRECDYLGNWLTVKNACVTECNEIGSPEALNDSNGYSYWKKMSDVVESEYAGENVVSASSCVDGYYPYPYPPLKSPVGINYQLTAGTPDYVNTIPENVALDTRAPDSKPQRACKSTSTDVGFVNIWTNPSSSCVNSCFGSDEDPRIGVGVTEHPTSQGKTRVSWQKTEFGRWSYVDSPSIGQQDSSQYFYGRINKAYSLARYCNPTTKKWDAPIPQCIINGGTIGDTKAIFYSPSLRASVGVQAMGSCMATTDVPSGSKPVYECAYANNDKNIDQVYYKRISGDNCITYCTAAAGQVIGNSKNPGSNTRIYSNAGNINLNLNCIDGYLPNVNSTPYVSCQSDGNWSGVYNDCHKPKDCDSNATISGSTYRAARIQCCSAGCCDCCAATDSSWGAGYDFNWNIRSLNASHGWSGSYSSRVGGDVYCGWEANYPSNIVWINFRCYDGIKYVW